MPDAASLMGVSGLGIAGATALALIRAAKLKEGDSVLVNGASGGIGHLVLQMCREEVGPSGKIVAVCSSSNTNWVEELCAGKTTPANLKQPIPVQKSQFEVVDYNLQAPVYAYLAKTFSEARFDAVIDAVGIQEIYYASPEFLAKDKPYVTVGPQAYSYTYLGMLSTIATMLKNVLWPQVCGGTPRPYIQVAAAANLADMEELAEKMEEGALRVHLDSCRGMEDVQKVIDFQ
jgi:NADPH:quinone reductase-like Zn-dependent oxidoreductase